jgi:hypothetical protein
VAEHDELKLVRPLGEKMTYQDWEGYENGQKVRVRIDADGAVVEKKYIVETNGKPGRPPGGKNAPFFKVYRYNWLDLMQKKYLTFHDVGVFFSLTTFLGWERGYLVHPGTLLPASEKEIAELMGFSRAGLHRYIKALEEKGLVAVLRGTGGKPNRIFLSPDVVYFGKYSSPVDVPEFKGDYKPEIHINRRKKSNGKEG